MKSKVLVLGLMIFLLGGQMGSPVVQAWLQHELDELSKEGFTVRVLENGWIETTHPITHLRQRFPVPRYDQHRTSSYPGLPTLTIDLTRIDTNLYNWKYHYINTVPVSGIEGYGLLAHDINRNGKTEVYGLFYRTIPTEVYGTRIFERTDTGWTLRYTYPFQIGVVENIDDIDLNGRKEIYARNGDSMYVFEQANTDNYPVTLKLAHNLGASDLIPNLLADMNNDGRKELLYHGGVPDSVQLSRSSKFIARYDTSRNFFCPIWVRQLNPSGFFNDSMTLSMAVGDFDGDARQEFVTSSFVGRVYLVEYDPPDSFKVTWTDSLSTAGRAGAGDVDGNGLDEFFIGGTQGEPDGYAHMRAFAYERTTDNRYEPFLAFNIFPVGVFTVHQFRTVDLDNDGQKELLYSFKNNILVIKGDGAHRYKLFYYKRTSSGDGASAGDVDSDGIPELFVSRFFVGGTGEIKQTEVYTLDSTLTDVEEVAPNPPKRFLLLENYPNPFNSTTTISYELPHRSHIKLTIFDIAGKEVQQLVDAVQSAGQHSIYWDGSRNGDRVLASGVYLCRLTADQHAQTRRLLLLR
jgi:hypothetical protein